MLTEHEEQCKSRSGSSKSNLMKTYSDKYHKGRALRRVQLMKEKVSELSEKADED